MNKNSVIMDKREEKLMSILWESKTPLTVTDIEFLSDDAHLSKATVFKAVQSLLEKGYIKVGGVEKSTKTYARKIEPAITKEEYAAILLSERGIGRGSIGDLVLAMLGCKDEKNEHGEDDERIIAELQSIIEEIRKKK